MKVLHSAHYEASRDGKFLTSAYPLSRTYHFRKYAIRRAVSSSRFHNLWDIAREQKITKTWANLRKGLWVADSECYSIPLLPNGEVQAPQVSMVVRCRSIPH